MERSNGGHRKKVTRDATILRDKYLNISKLEFDTDKFSYYYVCNVKCEFVF